MIIFFYHFFSTIQDSYILSDPNNRQISIIRIKSIEFNHVKFILNVNTIFFNMGTSDFIWFKNVDIEFHNSPAISINFAKEVKFESSHLKFLCQESISIKTDHLIFQDTIIEKPNSKSFQNMAGKNGSLLTIENVTLQDPDHDSLVAFFSNVSFENLKIEDSNCNCDFLRNLISPCPPEVFPCTPLNVSLRA